MLAIMATTINPTQQSSTRITSSNSSSVTSATQQDSNEPQRCCVVCERTSPKTIFSCRYKVHERNMDILQKFFERNDLRFGELCDRCYRLWYKHKRTKPLPNNAAKEGGKTNTSPAKLQQHESFHGKQSATAESANNSEEDDDTPVDDSSADEEMQVDENAVENTKKHTPQLVKIFQQQNALQQQKYLSRPSKIEKYVAADFSNCIRALTILSKPARKSKRKNTPVRSAPRLNSMHELVYGPGATSSTLARIVLLREEQQEFLLSLCASNNNSPIRVQQEQIVELKQQASLVQQEHAHEQANHHEDVTMETGNSAASIEREGNLFARMIQAASSKIAVQSS